MIGTQAEFEEWLTAEPRPPIVLDVARRVPPTTCYRLKSTGARGHYAVHSYSEDGTITFRHGKDSHMPGVAVFGIEASDAVPCGCGKWSAPTAAQTAATRRRILAQPHPPCGDPSCVFHRGRSS